MTAFILLLCAGAAFVLVSIGRALLQAWLSRHDP